LRRHDALALSLHALDALLSGCGVPEHSVAALRRAIVVVDPSVPHFAREVVLRSAPPHGACWIWRGRPGTLQVCVAAADACR